MSGVKIWHISDDDDYSIRKYKWQMKHIFFPPEMNRNFRKPYFDS